MQRFLNGASSLIVAALLPFASLMAQDSRGLISGRVLDPTGGAIPRADIKTINTATNVVSSSTSNEQGIYQIRYLLPGMYRIEVAAQGFKTYVRPAIEVRVGDHLVMDIPLEVGTVTETMNVTAAAPLLEAGTATLGSIMDERRIQDMPIHGGNTFSLARLAPGINSFVAPNLPTELSATNVVSWFGVDGTPQQNTEFAIDGTPSMSGRMPSYTPPPDLVSEFKIQTATYDASVGRTSGGAINVALKSGTNQLHGTLYELHNDAHLQSMDLFQRQFLYDPASGPVTDAKRKQAYPYNVFNRFGGSLSGPWYVPKLYDGRNKSFWIFGYEGYRRVRNEPGGNYFTVPTLKERQGDFSDLLALGGVYQVCDPATTTPVAGGRFSRQPLAGNIIPASRISPVARKILQYWPEPNTAGTADGLNNYYRPRRSWDRFGSYNGRVDHNATERYRIFGRYYKTSQIWTGGARVFDNNATGALLHRDSQGGGLDQIYTFSPSLLLNVRYSFARYITFNQPYSAGFDLVGLGLPTSLVGQLDPAAIQFPNVTPDGYQPLGNGNNNLSVTNYHVAAADFTWTRSAHSLRFGMEQRIYREHNYNFAGGAPALDFAANWTKGPLDTAAAAPIGQGLASLLFGLPTGGGVTINSSGAEQSTASSLFIQDDWKIARKLTLTCGLRWDYDGAITERYDRSVRGFAFTTPNPLEAQAKANYAKNPILEVPPDQFRVLGGLTFAGVGGQPRALWNAPRRNFSPRAGFAFSVNPKTVVRAGYGIFYVPIGADRSSVNQTGYSTRNTLVPSLDNGLTFVGTLANPFPDGLRQPVGSAGGLLTNAGQAVSFFNENPKTGYMQRWSLSVQRHLPANLVSEVSYVGNRGTRLEVSQPLDSLPVKYLSRSPVRDQTAINYLADKVANPFYPLLPGTGLSAATVNRSQLLLPYPQFTGVSVTQPVGYSWYHSLQATLERRFSKGF
ncbi:MAG: TonB-dependent receptor, partial [Acidobacteria bacterium]|nr:TonB-dependent receptor [Acidobacteriota bacterium]